MKRTTILIAGGAALAAVVAVSGCTGPESPATTNSQSRPASASPATSGAPLPAALGPTQVASLPATTYDAVIPGLIAAPAKPASATTHTVLFDSAVYGRDRVTPVARLTAKDFLGQPTVVVRVATEGHWSLVLVASRSILPSRATPESPAPAQTAAWIPTTALHSARRLTQRVVVSVSNRTLTIEDAKGRAQHTFPIGVGTPETPTPTDATGYLQARYLDPAQGQDVHPIQLTSLHATGADEPYGGDDGGLIGIHYQAQSSGAVSHGCLRLDDTAIDVVNGLPLGTLVTIVQ